MSLDRYRDPLIDRLNDRKEEKTHAEHEYIASVWADPDHKWPTPNQVEMSREHLRPSAAFLEFPWKDGKRGKTMEAYGHVCEVFEIDLKTARHSVKYARKLGDGEWWNSAERMAKKGKSLRFTH